MSNKNQFYFSVEKLENLLHQFKGARSSSSEKKILRGFVFTPGEDSDNQPCCFAFPLYSDQTHPSVIEEKHLLVQNTSGSNHGCPYPPPC
jgi:hypothetical protein